jgi:ferredoxin
MTKQLFSQLPPSFAAADVYLCGPDGMMTEVLAALAFLGVADRRIKTERFVVGLRNPSIVPEPGGPRTVAIHVNGVEYRALAFAGATLLDTGLDAGAPMPFSCSVGGCGVCRVRLIDGSVTMEEPNCLTIEERREGWVLSCVARADAGGCTLRVEEEGDARR